MQVLYDSGNEEYYVREKIDNQTFEMGFQPSIINVDTCYVNVWIQVYNKRKHLDRNENLILSTGHNPFKTYILAKKAFEMLEKVVLLAYNKNYNVIIFCYWLDNRRRDIYYKALHKKGYNYINLSEINKKVIAKKWKKGEWNI